MQFKRLLLLHAFKFSFSVKARLKSLQTREGAKQIWTVKSKGDGKIEQKLFLKYLL